MRKNELKICILFAILGVLLFCCLMYNTTIGALKHEADIVAQKRKRFARLFEKISKRNLNIKKNKEQLLKVCSDVRKYIVTILKKINPQKVAIRTTVSNFDMYNLNNINLQFETKSEQSIYYFLQNLNSRFNAVFGTIKISKSQPDNFKVEIKFHCVEFKKIDKDIRIEPKERCSNKKGVKAIKKIRIFSKNNDVPKHILRGIINGVKAFIDKEWKKVGDFVEDAEIIDISDNSIIIEIDSMQNKINVGNFF